MAAPVRIRETAAWITCDLQALGTAFPRGLDPAPLPAGWDDVLEVLSSAAADDEPLSELTVRRAAVAMATVIRAQRRAA